MRIKYRVLQAADFEFYPQGRVIGIIPSVLGVIYTNITTNSYKTLDEAKDAIADHKKYPIIHEIK